jgi:hypothetical protein
LISPWSTENFFKILPATHFFTEASANRFLPVDYEESGRFYKPENYSRLYLIAIWEPEICPGIIGIIIFRSEKPPTEISSDGKWELWAGQIWLILGRNNTLSG